MKTYKEILDYHIQCGFWSSENDDRYGYVLSPGPFCLSKKDQNKLVEVGKAVHCFQESARKIGAHLYNSNAHFSGPLRQVLKQALGGLPFVSADQNVPLCKVDLMVDTNGQFQIAEVDSYNPRGIIYDAFVRTVFLDQEHKFFQGAEAVLKKEVERRGTRSLVWMYAHHERYYLTGLEQLKRIMKKKYDITITLLDAQECSSDSDFSGKVILMVPWGMNQGSEVSTRKYLAELYEQEPERFIFPMVPWLGTKAFMGIISNAGEDENIEEVVRRHVSESDLMLIRKYLPASALVCRSSSGSTMPWLVQKTKTSVLKANVSSGLKDITLSSDDGFGSKLWSALRMTRPNYMLQKYVQQKQFEIPFFNREGETLEARWYVRLTIQVTCSGEVAGATVTGRRSPDVHGATDCILLPATLL